MNRFVIYLKKQQTYYYVFGLFIIAFLSLFVSVESAHNKLWTNDFRVYYDATIDYFNGNNPYLKNYGLDTGYFKYPPFTLYIFKAFTFFDYGVSQLIHLFLEMISLILSISIIKELVQKHYRLQPLTKQIWILYVAFLVVAIHLVREFHLGNINLYLLVLFVLGLKKCQENRFLWSAIFWSLMLILKPIMVLAMIPLLFYKKWKIIGYMAVFGLIFFLFPIVHEGWNGNLVLWNNWSKSVSSHGEYIVSQNSLTYLAKYYFGIKSTWMPSFICCSVLITLLRIQLAKRGMNSTDFLKWTIVFTAFTPNFFVTDTEHFLLVLPLCVLLLYFLSKLKNGFAWFGFAIGMLFFSFNSNDLWGKKLSEQFDVHGILGIGNLLFVIVLLIVDQIIYKKLV